MDSVIGGSVDVMVIGAGVMGLSTAVLLRESGLDAHIVASKPPLETTSSVAAAIWYPYKASPEDRIIGWGKRAYDVFEELSGRPETGVHMRDGLELHYGVSPPPFWASVVPSVRRVSPDELPSGRHDGYAFTVPVVEMPVYLRYLVQRLEALGGSIEHWKVESVESVAGEARIIVNCAGLGARDLVGDKTTHPIRGQIVRVRNPGLTDFILDDDNPKGVTYIIPRSEDCILGGIAEDDAWEMKPDPTVAKGILSRCIDLEPRLAEAELLEHKVGLRPGRPEIRLEVEELDDDTTCVHNYGHGGSGITLSWGCAAETADLVRRVSESL